MPSNTHTPAVDYTDPALAYASLEESVTCGFCGSNYDWGYAKRDADGKWRAACWSCVKPESAGAPQPKRAQVGNVVLEPDFDAGGPPNIGVKAPGLAPSTFRPRTK